MGPAAMELADLGFDHWFQEKEKDLNRHDCQPARVVEVNRDSYIVKSEYGEAAAELTGALLYSLGSSADFPTVGDWVLVQYHNDYALAIIHAVFPRRSFIRRKASGRKIDYQMIAANIDVALIVQSCDCDFNVRRLERYLVMVSEGRIEPVLLLTKSDLVSAGTIDARTSEVRQSNIGCRILTLSNRTGAGQDQVRQLLTQGKTYCLLGSSGVGKTTLVNHLLGEDRFDTRAVREHDGKGRHATARRQLVVLDQGAMLIDTPGMRELGNIGVDGGIDENFSDVLELAGKCRFANCTHTRESGCALLAAMEDGELGEERYRNYLKLLGESEYYQMSYVEKRKKDRAFGQFIKSVKKDMRRK
jgi:ribosome biogenesis GTPase